MKRSSWAWVALGVTAAAVLTVVAIVAMGDEDPGQPNDGKPLPSTVAVAEDVRYEMISGRCGYEVVVTAETTVDPRNGQFCLVRLDVRNRGEEPRTFDPSCQYLIDLSGNRHTQREDVLSFDEVTTDFFEQELAPGTLAHDVGLYYDVEKGLQAADVELHTSCDSPGVRLAVTG